MRETWTGISGTTINSLTSNANYPNNPTGRDQVTSLEGPINWADNYGTRIRGYIHPPASGSYTFWVAGDDNTDLYLSSSDNPANRSRIAYVDGWTDSKQWNKFGTQQSAAINLVAGQKYYIEVLHKEGSGGDHVAVAWQGPGIAQQVIAGNYLSPLVPAPSSTSAAKMSSKSSMNENAVSLYPNPANAGRFTVLLPGIVENAVVKIYDSQGRMLYEKLAHGDKKIKIDSGLKAGFYIVRIYLKAISYTKKLIVVN